ncbi:MAG: hypothetical protein K2P95_06890 [Hyphomonadaceae bacterium]|nr:hypothetical protein [Hyphomonadaceae bacterium]
MRLHLLAAAALALTACDRDAAPQAGGGASTQPGACQGFDPKRNAGENAARTGAFLASGALPEAERARVIGELAATLQALPAWLPVPACAVQLSAETPPDGSGTLQLSFEIEHDAAALAKMYADQFQGRGEIESSVEEGHEGVQVHTVTLRSAEVFAEAHIRAFPAETGMEPIVSVTLRGEGLPH